MSSPVHIVGRYALYGEIAAGGMATVHFGRLLGPVGFSRTVAIKRLHPQYAKDPEFVAMFLDEARLAARIRHPNVVQTLDVVATNGELFLVMDYVQGESLSRLARKRAVPPKIVAAIVSGVLHGLHAAHEARNERGEPLNIVHRDISPQNILIGVDGSSRVLDFGVAKASGRSQTTREGHIKGKIAYMAPEQFRGAATRQTDVYATAIVTWEALTGQRLFAGADEVETLSKALSGKVASPSSIVANLPAGYDEVVLKGLAADPEKRYATAREMALALERCAGLASPSEVGEWVDELAKDALSKRLRKVSEIESSSPAISMPTPTKDELTPSGDAPVLPPAGPEGATSAGEEPSLVSSVGAKEATTGSGSHDGARPSPEPPSGIAVAPTNKSEAPQSKRNRLVAPLGVAAILVLLFFALRPLWHTPADPAPLHADVAPTTSPISPTAADPGTAQPIDPLAPSAQPIAQTANADLSAPPLAASAPNVRGTTPRANAFPAQPQNRPLPQPKRNCDPAFTIDAAGHKHYKPECL